MTFAAKALGAAQRVCSIVCACAQQRGLGGLCVERNDVYFVRVAAVVHGQIAEHAVEADIGQVGRLLGSGLGFGLDLGMLVDVGHGGYGAAAGAYTCKAADRGRPWRRRRLRDEGRTTSMESTKRRPRCRRVAGVGAAKRSCAWIGRGVRVEARRGRLGVEENRLGHGGRLILGDDDAAVARVVEVYLRQRPVMAAPGGQGRSVQRIRLALGVVERVGLGIQQMARVTLLGRRVEHRRRRRVGRAAAFSAAKQVSDHVEWAHSSMEARPSS
jgi:hypothetical protein